MRVLFFGVLREQMGVAETELELTAGARLGEVLAWASEKLPECALLRSVALAVNQVYATAERVLCEGDEVALLPPVSGGVVLYGFAVTHV